MYSSQPLYYIIIAYGIRLGNTGRIYVSHIDYHSDFKELGHVIGQLGGRMDKVVLQKLPTIAANNKLDLTAATDILDYSIRRFHVCLLFQLSLH